MRLVPSRPHVLSLALARPAAGLLSSLLIAATALAGCHRSSLPPAAAPFQSQPRLAYPGAVQAPSKAIPAPEAAAGLADAKPETNPLALASSIAEAGGLINDLPAMTRQLETSAYSLQVVPAHSQEKADRIARDWAPDAQQLYVIWAYWKLPALSVTRHAYYSPSKGMAFKVEFTLSSLFAKSFEEPADGFDQATLILNEARDRHAVDAKDAHAIARRMGYVPNTYGAAVLLDIKTYGPMWVFADMPSQTQGEPVMLVHAETGMVTQGGEALLLAKYLFQRAGY